MSGSRTMEDGCGIRFGFVAAACLMLGFMSTAVTGADNAAIVTEPVLPDFIAPGGSATVTVVVSNTGTTPWGTTVYQDNYNYSWDDDYWYTRTTTSYALTAVGASWGGSDPVTGSVAPSASRSFTVTVTAPAAGNQGSQALSWRMCRVETTLEMPSGVLGTTSSCFGASTASQTIWVGTDTVPTFGAATIGDLVLTKDEAYSKTLPSATGGNGALSYDVVEDLPAGLGFNPATRVLSGTPTTLQSAAQYTYTATDADGNTAPSDADTLPFSDHGRTALQSGGGALGRDGGRGRLGDLRRVADLGADDRSGGAGRERGRRRRDGRLSRSL